MKKMFLVVCFVIFVVFLSSCTLTAEPIEDPKIEEFEELYVNDDYTVLAKKEEYRAELYTMEGYGFGHNDDTCNVGSFERTNYMFFYKGEYYDIVEFNKFKLIKCSDLSKIGIVGLSYEE